jgi:hypothetical protein
LAISVEGETEEAFVKQVLAPHLSRFRKDVFTVLLRGNVSIERASAEIQRLTRSNDYVATFYDLYGFKGAPSSKRVLEQAITDAIPIRLRAKVIPHVQQYEFESLLFSSPDILGNVLKLRTDENYESAVAWATSVLSTFSGNAENINNSRLTAPSKRLETHTNYRKTTHGPRIAREIGLAAIRAKCAGFDSWLTRLEGL